MVADVKSPGGGIPAGARASRVTGGAPKMPSLLLATETEVTATDFDSRTDLTDLETDAGEHLGGAGMGDEERREKMAAGMIQLAFRKHAVRRRKLRRKVAGSGLGSVEEVAEAKTKTKTPGEDDDSEDDEDVKKDVKKVVKKAEKAALKITSSIRSLKTNKNQPTEDPGLGKRGRRSGGESREPWCSPRRCTSAAAPAEVHHFFRRGRRTDDAFPRVTSCNSSKFPGSQDPRTNSRRCRRCAGARPSLRR